MLRTCTHRRYVATPLIMVPHNIDPSAVEAAATALRDLYLRSHRVLDRRMTADGASFARARLLMQIAEQRGARSTDLATAFGFAPRTVTEAIDGLERDGLVRREPDPEDRRAKRLVLTDAGRAVAEKAERSLRDHTANMFGILSKDECDTFVRLLGKVNDRLVELGG